MKSYFGNRAKADDEWGDVASDIAEMLKTTFCAFAMFEDAFQCLDEPFGGMKRSIFMGYC